MVEVKLKYKNQNFIILIDDEDREVVKDYKWSISSKRGVPYIISNNKLYLHRLLTKAENKQYVDHINGNTLDNRKCNLRICSNKENVRNCKMHKNNISGFKGVSKKKKRIKPFMARITVNYKEIYLGYYNTASEAAEVYNKAAIKYFGKFARLNEIK